MHPLGAAGGGLSNLPQAIAVGQLGVGCSVEGVVRPPRLQKTHALRTSRAGGSPLVLAVIGQGVPGDGGWSYSCDQYG